MNVKNISHVWYQTIVAQNDKKVIEIKISKRLSMNENRKKYYWSSKNIRKLFIVYLSSEYFQ